MAADYIKLFKTFRLSPSEPHHLSEIKVRLSAMKSEAENNPDKRERAKAMAQYEEYSEFYKIEVEVEAKPKEEKKEEPEEAPKKKTPKKRTTKKKSSK